jgi:hypothetical protein
MGGIKGNARMTLSAAGAPGMLPELMLEDMEGSIGRKKEKDELDILTPFVDYMKIVNNAEGSIVRQV